jgi:hypothetical protein
VPQAAPAKTPAVQPGYLPAQKTAALDQPPGYAILVTQASATFPDPAEPTAAAPAPAPAAAAAPAPAAQASTRSVEALAEQMGHAPDFNWVCGTLWYYADEGLWRVNYGAKEEDKFGGTLTLTDLGPLPKEFHVGQMVYVEGHLLDVGPNSVYQVYKILQMAPPQ